MMIKNHTRFIGLVLSLYTPFVILTGCLSKSSLDEHPCDVCRACETCELLSGETVCVRESGASRRCMSDGHIHVLDSCGDDEGIERRCPDNSTCIDGENEPPTCECINRFEGDDCDICPANYDAENGCAACLEPWDPETDCRTCLGNFDPISQCTECLGNWDLAADCTACKNYYVDEDNDCGTCPEQYDPTTDCASCLGNWNPEDKCESCLDNYSYYDDCATCLGNWDLETDCTVCRNGYIDEDNDCGTCPVNYDPASDCAGCLGNWDISTGCTSCLYHYIDEENDCGTCPANFDPETLCYSCLANWEGASCDICPGNWDEANGCAVCRNHWVDNLNDCGTCPETFDPETDCADCLGHYDGEDCDVCSGNWDEASGCTVCRNHWTDNGDDCGTCPANFDPAADCDACLPGRDLDDDCQSCRVGFDEETDCQTCSPGWFGEACDVCVRFVSPNGDPTADGRTWDTAIGTLGAGVAALSDAIDSPEWPDRCTLAIAGMMYNLSDESPGGLFLSEGMALVGGFSENDDPLMIPTQTDTTIQGTSRVDGTSLLHVVTVDADVESYEVNLINLTITGGRAEGDSGDARFGGGLLIRNGNVRMGNCTVTDNTAANLGGGIHLAAGNLTVTNSRITSNSAYSGGGIYVADGEFSWGASTINNLVMLNTVVSDNLAEEVGGGLQFYNYYGDFYAVNTVWTRNHARLGGALEISGGDDALTLYHATIAGNSADSLGAAISFGGDLRIVSSILYDNNAASFYDADGINTSNFDMDIQYSLINDNDGEGNFYANPEFTSATDFTLQPGSPCIDAGYGFDDILMDIDNHPRVDDPDSTNSGAGTVSFADVGAYEFQPITPKSQ